jgi:NADH dehydrogenase [ubiquinone] 1 alpha subcomplex assembly factor 5
LLPTVRAKAVHLGDDYPASGTARREREIEHRLGEATNQGGDLPHSSLSPEWAHRTSVAVPELFDMKLRAMRRDRAARAGPELFLFNRAFEDCIERIALMGHRFDRALLIGCPDPRWLERLSPLAPDVDARDPGFLFAAAAGGAAIVEDAWESPAQAYDLVLAIGTLDTVNDLPLALRLVRHAMRSGALFIGAFAGGDTLPQLRSAMRAADSLSGGAAPHVHPRIEPSALSPLLGDAGFVRPVVDVDRLQANYPSLDRLVADLRGMGATNVLHSRPPPLSRAQHRAATTAFAEAGAGHRTRETFEILHFAAWTAANG